jgi:hypothetical protein
VSDILAPIGTDCRTMGDGATAYATHGRATKAGNLVLADEEGTMGWSASLERTRR